jgi:hypothetical protein
VALLLASRGGEEVLRCGSLLLHLKVVLDAVVVTISSSTWLRGGGKALAEMGLCFMPGSFRKLLSGGCGGWLCRPVQNPSILSRRFNLVEVASLSLLCPKVACSPAVVRWPELDGSVGSLE